MPNSGQKTADLPPSGYQDGGVSSFAAEGTHRDAFEAKDWVLFLVPGIIWGTSFLFIAESLKAFHPGVVTFGRIALGCLALGVMPKARQQIDRADRLRVAAIGVSWLAFPMTLFPLAQQHITSGLAGMLNGSISVFTAIASSILLRRLPGRFQLVGLCIGIVGVVLLGIPSINSGGSKFSAAALVVIACASYGLAATLAVPLTQKYGSMPVFWRAQLVSVVLTAPFGLYGVTGGRSTFEWKPAMALLALGVLGTCVAFILMTMLGSRVGSTRSASLTYFEAVFALVVGVVVVSEEVVPIEVVGCGVLLIGAWLSSRADT
jgi:drug/metabolite transporter (DMT)-like permease